VAHSRVPCQPAANVGYSFRTIKDVVALPLHRLICGLAGLPESAGRAAMGVFGGLGRAAYLIPGSHVRRTVRDFCQATGRSDPWPIYSRMVSNLEQAALHYGVLYRRGCAELLAQTVIDASVVKQYERFGNDQGGLILLVPHCAAAVLSSARLSKFCPTVLLVREARSPVRCQLMMEYLQKLGTEVILTRNAQPASVMRSIMRALRDHKVVVGTTDVIHPGPDTVETRAFGQQVHSPSWPARISARLGVPIVPGFIHMEGRQIRMLADEGYQESDPQKSTQRWLSSFERWFQQYPSDWVFMLDKRWARVLSAAASRQMGTSAAESMEYSRAPIKTGAGPLQPQ
jgi:lauroyl/myristoyl acyltransferase